MITDVGDSLPWARAWLRGWGVGFYRSQDTSEGPEVFVSSEEPSIATLRTLVEQCLARTASANRHHR